MRGMRGVGWTLVAALGVLAVVAPAAAQHAPVIEHLEPSAGPPGTRLEIVGRGFDAQTTATLDGAPLTMERVTPSRIVARIGNAARTGAVALQGAFGVARGAVFRVTQRVDVPTITRLSPTSGPPGTEVRIDGTGFDGRFSRTRVALSAQSLVVVEASGVQLRVLIPEGAQSGPFEVSVLDAEVAVRSTRFEVTAAPGQSTPRDPTPVPPPVAPETANVTENVPLSTTSFAPRSGPAGTLVTIVGTGFSPAVSANRVRMAGRVLDVLGATATELQVRITPGGSGPLEVTRDGRQPIRTEAPFVVTAPAVIERVTPLHAVVGTEVTLVGRRFGDDPLALKVRVGERLQEVVSTRDDALVFRVVPGTVTGEVSVTLLLHGRTTFDAPLVIAEAADSPAHP